MHKLYTYKVIIVYSKGDDDCMTVLERSQLVTDSKKEMMCT